MALDRIRRVGSIKEMENVTDDYITMGYQILSRGEKSIRIRQHGGWGSAGGHIITALLSLWWTFGVGNLLYALYTRYSGEKVLIKLVEKEEG
ncbi:hypothetical protein LF817_18470 [Halobacillus sp. A1]|uniref:hypothetical protein n=1 Tax=Halobacillus sp. A1 TaxID=2880262 RepID=UPI0020A67AD7|nr:hypothetical protein [Halobacillus sp. A1]MCP3033314.1 hypothetical protein [Halobacillus sp. A1]